MNDFYYDALDALVARQERELDAAEDGASEDRLLAIIERQEAELDDLEGSPS